MRHLFNSAPSPRVAMIPLPDAGEGAVVYVREMGAKDLLALRNTKGEHPVAGGLEYAYEVLWRTLCDEKGELVFASLDDIIEGFNLPPRLLDELAKESAKHSKLTVEEKN